MYIMTLEHAMYQCRDHDPKVLPERLLRGLKTISKILTRDFGIPIKAAHFYNRPVQTKAKLKKLLKSILSEHGFATCSTWSPIVRTSNSSVEEPSFELAIRDLNLVNASKLTWQEIIEFRKDEDSAKALRDLRLFFHENFVGKEKDYIQDKLFQLIDRHETMTKLWKFETVQKSLSVAFTNQSAIAASAAGLATAVAGGPLSVVAAAALTIPLAGCAVEFAKVAIDAKKEKIDRPTRFLTKLKNLNSGDT